MVLITGSAGFIGYHLCKRLLELNEEVIGIDNLNDYYDVQLKIDRLSQLANFSNFVFKKIDLIDKIALQNLFIEYKFDYVINLAAQAGVRYSVENPYVYVDSNLVGFLNVLECVRHNKVKHFVYASTSSVYGANKVQPFNEGQAADHPMSLYSATKKANELISHSYSSLYNLPTTGLRFFTVYGPWGRPDMSLFKFTKNILADIAIDVYNYGDMIRDFTYIDDIVEGVKRIIYKVAEPDESWDGVKPNSSSSYAPYRIYNIGNHKPMPLMNYINALEKALGKKAKINYMPMQAGEVLATDADMSLLEKAIGYAPNTSVEKGITSFVSWYREYYDING